MKLSRFFTLMPAFMSLLFVLPVSAYAAKGVKISQPVTLSPHRAVYEITLVDMTNASGISGLRGRLVFELGGSSCDGYTINMRFVTEITDQQGGVNVTDLRTSSWESGEGSNFRFNSSEYTNSRLKTVTSGDAVRTSDNENVHINLKRPKAQKINFSSKILFPTQHSIQLISAALRGDNVMQADLYDGSEQGAKVYSTTAIIGKTHNPGNTGLGAVANSEPLNQISSWPVSIGYFERDKSEDLPSYQIAFRLFENGVSRNLLIDYGSFSIKGELKKIDFFPPGKCG